MKQEYKILEEIKTEQNNNVVLLGLNNTKNQTLVIGVVHGDEPQGEDLINKYLTEHLKENVLFICKAYGRYIYIARFACFAHISVRAHRRGNTHRFAWTRVFQTGARRPLRQDF